MNVSMLPIIDIEASGFGRKSYPIEVGYVLSDGRSFCSLVCPARDWTHWDESAAEVHGITRSTRLAHGTPALEVARRLNTDLLGLTVYCDGWAHDYSWLAALFEEAGLNPSFKLESVNRLLAQSQLAQLDQQRRAALAQMGLTRHRASNDARALQQALVSVGGGAAGVMPQTPLAPMPPGSAHVPAPVPATGAT